ncbi:unnamed protein product [Cunninghamella blakesleeana]
MKDIESEELGIPTTHCSHASSSSSSSSLDKHSNIQYLIKWTVIFIIIGIVSFYTIISLANNLLDITIPHSLEEIKNVATYLLTISTRGSWIDFFKVVFIFASLYLWQQTFSLPGTVLLNCLSGYLYGIGLSTLWTSYLTALGSTFAYLLSYKIGKPIMNIDWIQKRAKQMEKQMEKDKEMGIFWWLLFARLFPFSPYWFINLASPLINIPISPFFWSTFFGSMPYNFVCSQAGTILGELTSTSDIFTFSMMVKLLFVSFISLIPIFYGKWIQEKLKWLLEKKQLNNNNNNNINEEDDDIELNHCHSSTII